MRKTTSQWGCHSLSKPAGYSLTFLEPKCFYGIHFQGSLGWLVLQLRSHLGLRSDLWLTLDQLLKWSRSVSKALESKDPLVLLSLSYSKADTAAQNTFCKCLWCKKLKLALCAFKPVDEQQNRRHLCDLLSHCLFKHSLLRVPLTWYNAVVTSDLFWWRMSLLLLTVTAASELSPSHQLHFQGDRRKLRGLSLNFFSVDLHDTALWVFENLKFSISFSSLSYFLFPKVRLKTKVMHQKMCQYLFKKRGFWKALWLLS